MLARTLLQAIPTGHVPRNSLVVNGSVQVDIHKGLNDRRAGLRVISVLHNLGGIDVRVVIAGEVEFEGYVGGEVELGVWKRWMVS